MTGTDRNERRNHRWDSKRHPCRYHTREDEQIHQQLYEPRRLRLGLHRLLPFDEDACPNTCSRWHVISLFSATWDEVLNGHEKYVVSDLGQPMPQRLPR